MGPRVREGDAESTIERGLVKNTPLKQ